MRTKRTINGKEYHYELMGLWIKPDVHQKLKELSKENDTSMTKYLSKLIDEKYNK